LVTSTYAWFTVNTFAGVQDFELQISTADDLRVSMDNHGSDIDKYTHFITNDMINSYLRKNYNLTLEDILLDPVTTNDGKTFTFQNGAKTTPNLKEGSYFEFECYFIATRAMGVHLSTEGIDEEGNKADGTKVTSKSPAPMNDVVKANRIAFDPDGGSVNTYEPNKGSAVTRLSTFDLPSGTMTYNSSNKLFELDKLTPKKVAIRLWLEGEDPECDNDIQRSELKVRLSFAGVRDGQNTPG
jgi:hypothetical protein